MHLYNSTQPTDNLAEAIVKEFGKRSIDNIEIPPYIVQNINPNFTIRPYQKDAFRQFICYQENQFTGKQHLNHLLLNMATGSGKTLIMAGMMLYLYQQGYRHFLFFVNATNILAKTKDNFLNKSSKKYLFSEQIIFNGKQIDINEVSNFEQSHPDSINIFFTTIQGLHQDLTGLTKENSITEDDFNNTNIVLLSDEAHHINVATKKSTLNEKNWEETVQNIFKKSRQNILLEFTATIDLSHPAIRDKYNDKLLYKYDLLNFRQDGYSKEIKTLSLDSDLDQVMLHAILLSQYRLKIAEKYRLSLKPVILFKAQKTIEQSNANEQKFKQLIQGLNTQQLERLLKINFTPKDNTILVSAFSYLDKIYHQNYDNLINELKDSFSDEKIINVNEKSKEKYQLLLNNLEDKDNPIRAIFAVNKLNEGWDVLNLFDIVRLYDTRDGNWQKDGTYKAGSTTLSEAQLIGRGARYYPFSLSDEDQRHKRKYDEEPDNDLKILEELHYHSKYNSRYLDELDKALIEQGLKDPKPKDKTTINFVDDNFYKNKTVFKNKPIINDNKDKNGFSSYDIPTVFQYSLSTDKITERQVFGYKSNSPTNSNTYRLSCQNISNRIFYKAFNQNKHFWNFNNLKQFFGNITTIDDLLDKKYFYSIDIETNKNELSNDDKLQLISRQLLPAISKTITQKAKHKKGSTVFYDYAINQVFRKVKELHFDSQNKEINIEQIREHFLHDKLFGTSEEEHFINFFSAAIKKLLCRYTEVKLLRNNRELKLYRFDDGETFEPDFLLFLTTENGDEISYQVFIEPKGDHLIKHDEAKQNFLEQIKDKYELTDLFHKNKYQLLGLRFYNRNQESQFRENFEQNLL